MKRLSTWDTYVTEAAEKGDRSIELPLTDDETYVIGYPTRRQGRAIAKAQRENDTDALLVALLGKEAGRRVRALAEDQPAYVLDDFLIDVMKKFGMIPDDDTTDADAEDVPLEIPEDVPVEDELEPKPVPKRKPATRSAAKTATKTATKAATNGRAAGKSRAKSKTRLAS